MLRSAHLRQLLWLSTLVLACDPGQPPLAESASGLIGGGTSAEGTLAAVGALVVTDGNGSRSEWCTATVVSERLLFTSATCVEAWKARVAADPKLSIGFWDGNSVQSGISPLAVDKFVSFPEFDYAAFKAAFKNGLTPKVGKYFDLGIAHLAQPTTIPPLKLLSPSDADKIAINDHVLTLIGYGRSNAGDPASAGSKRQGTAKIYSRGNTEIQVYGQANGAAQLCFGDEGAALISEVSGDGQRLYAVASRFMTDSSGGKQCIYGAVATRSDYYNRVSNYNSWIVQQGGLPCGSGTSASCPAPTLKFGDPCSKHEECPDRLCFGADANKECSKACWVRGPSCPAGTRCAPAGGSVEWGACVKMAMIRKTFGERCNAPEDCVDQVCIDGNGGKFCSKPCNVKGDSCPTGTQCSATNSTDQGVCAKKSQPLPKKVGEPCEIPEQCEAKLCVPAQAGKICSKPCDLKNDDCPAGTHCLALEGGTACSNAQAPALKKAGEPCENSDECEEKLCLPAEGRKLCTKSCQPQNDTCPTGTRCLALGDSSGKGTCVSGQRALPKGFGDPCEKPEECLEQLCIFSGGHKICSRSCDLSKNDCPPETQCASVGDRPENGACLKLAASGEYKQAGEACAADAECESRLCLTGSDGKKCAKPCHTTAVCPDDQICVESHSGTLVCADRPAGQGSPAGGCSYSAPPAGTTGLLLLIGAALGLLLRPRSRS